MMYFQSIRPMNDGAKKAELNMALDILKVRMESMRKDRINIKNN